MRVTPAVFFVLPAVARYGQCASGVTCQLVRVPTPFFLAAQRRTASAVKKKLPKENPWEGFSLNSFGNKRAAALLRSRESQIYSAHPVERLLRILEALSFWHASTYWHVKSLTILLPSSKFGRLVRRKAFLLCKNPCGAGCDGGRGTSSQRTQPRAKKFSEKICFAPSWVYQVCRTPRLESTQKYAGTLDS